MNILDTLAGGDVLKYEAVLAMDCRTCLVKLVMEKESRNFQKRLAKIYSQKAPK